MTPPIRESEIVGRIAERVEWSAIGWFIEPSTRKKGKNGWFSFLSARRHKGLDHHRPISLKKSSKRTIHPLIQSISYHLPLQKGYDHHPSCIAGEQDWTRLSAGISSSSIAVAPTRFSRVGQHEEFYNRWIARIISRVSPNQLCTRTPSLLLFPSAWIANSRSWLAGQ